MSKIKTSLFVESAVWKEIKKVAIDAGQTVGEFITKLFIAWRCEHDSNPANQASRAKDRPD